MPISDDSFLGLECGAPTQLDSPSADRAGIEPLFNLRVLVIEDDRDIALTFQRVLQRHGMRIDTAFTGNEAVALKTARSYQIILVDLELPDLNGQAMLRWLVKQRDCGIIVVSGHADEASRVMCLEIGADDYITKPPNLRELVARIHAVHRRTTQATTPLPHNTPPSPHKSKQRTVSLGDFTVNLESHQIYDATEQFVDLTTAEFVVLEALINSNGTPVSREHLSEIALNRRWSPDDRSVDQLIYRVRQKLTMEGKSHRIIQAIRNGGYRIVQAGASNP